jgi:hypothetical protein
MTDIVTWDTSNVIESTYSHYVIFGCSLFALVWGGVNASMVRKVELDAENI